MPTQAVGGPARSPHGGRGGRRVALGLAAGGGGGLVFGGAFRAWMRLISEEPEFSWTGTLFILGAFTVVGAMAGLVRAGRRLGWRRALPATRAAAVLVGLPCFTAAGALTFPPVALGSLAAGRTDWPAGARIALAAVAVGGTALVLPELDHLPPAGLVGALVAYLVLIGVEVLMFATFAAPGRPSVA